ncbi:MAG: phosphoribosyltransferase [Anaerolineales bacterium]|nr:phosphoribosyltransferase [Anaerolineales bacterium]MDP3184743.1 phosphoribosyltransferase [Anaerolineales bacterium]
MNDKVPLDFETISRAIKRLNLPLVDCVVGIAEDGTIPAVLLAHQLERPLRLLHINYRAPDNSPQHPAPALLMDVPPLPDGAHIILLVDDVSVSGQTLALARGLLGQHEVVTFTLKGQADIMLFPEIASCVNWPWKA